MIGTVKIAVLAHSPNMTLEPWYAFKSSPSNIRVIGVPLKIGLWEITKVYIKATYPDNALKTVECVRNGSVWVATIDGCNVSGKSTNGYAVSADGTDEKGNAITGYILGKGDIVILDSDGTLSSDGTVYYMHLYQEQPETPKYGDVCLISSVIKMYDGNDWVEFGKTDDLISSLVYDKLLTDKEISSYYTYQVSPVSADAEGINVNLGYHVERGADYICPTFIYDGHENAMANAKPFNGSDTLTWDETENFFSLPITITITRTQASKEISKEKYVTNTVLDSKGYLTEHQSLSAYYTKSLLYQKTETYSKSEVDTKIAAVPKTQTWNVRHLLIELDYLTVQLSANDFLECTYNREINLLNVFVRGLVNGDRCKIFNYSNPINSNWYISFLTSGIVIYTINKANGTKEITVTSGDSWSVDACLGGYNNYFSIIDVEKVGDTTLITVDEIEN